MSDIARLDAEVNQLILEGKALEAFDRYYHDDVVMQENSDAPTVGHAANRERELAFFGMIAKVHAFALGPSGAGENVSFGEWTIDAELTNGYRMNQVQVSRRLWKDGKVIHERFFYKPA